MREDSQNDYMHAIILTFSEKTKTDKKSGKSERSKRNKKPKINEMSKKSERQGKIKQQTEQKERSKKIRSYEKKNFKTNEQYHRKKVNKRVERNEIFKSTEKSRMGTRISALRKTERQQSFYDPGKDICTQKHSIGIYNN